ncbi:hypothetical protein CONLIGDRAFT_315559 [Coniochaeta ligniaria NRRL 30616]|uniref:Uncharacterized protein n=1 Tax=Coniochaeta ligniaria NRRL 30616 TaxID=1408157 RepID=A0A1J7IW06_9PEZI|nr:hypothetical protein CONLIGDRAFT_315559 [Coniochaeta ligniaria NRRL 30616]
MRHLVLVSRVGQRLAGSVRAMVVLQAAPLRAQPCSPASKLAICGDPATSDQQFSKEPGLRNICITTDQTQRSGKHLLFLAVGFPSRITFAAWQRTAVSKETNNKLPFMPGIWMLLLRHRAFVYHLGRRSIDEETLQSKVKFIRLHCDEAALPTERPAHTPYSV